MGSSVLEINVGLCASISVCKFQFIFAKASLVVKLLCASCESRGDFLCPCTVVTCLEMWQQVTVKSWPKSTAKNQRAGRFAVVSARLTNTANRFFYTFSTGFLVRRTASSRPFWHGEPCWVTADFAELMSLHSRRWTKAPRLTIFSEQLHKSCPKHRRDTFASHGPSLPSGSVAVLLGNGL